MDNNKEISQETLSKLHSLTLQMAKEFVEFCEENKLLCYLCGGGCIGAVRHHGWIPWDDDLDFFMPREDYEKAIILWEQQKQNSRYKLEVSDENHVDGNLFFTIRDSKTTFIKPYQKKLDIVHGIVLDVLPLDGYPDKKSERRKQCFWALIYSLYCAQIVPTNHGKLVSAVGRIMLALVRNPKKRYHIYMSAKSKMTKYKIRDCNGITELCSGPGYLKNWYPKSAFSKAEFVTFEDTKMPIPIGYDIYLKTAFGNYMEMPPEDKRIPSHDAEFVDLDHSYKKYKGIYFL